MKGTDYFLSFKSPLLSNKGDAHKRYIFELHYIKQVGIPTKARAGFLPNGLGTIRSASLGFENKGYLHAGFFCKKDAKRLFQTSFDKIRYV